MFREIIDSLFAKPTVLCVESALRRACENIAMSTSKIYYNPARMPDSFEKLPASVPKKNYYDF